jgi:hypothetical protein
MANSSSAVARGPHTTGPAKTLVCGILHNPISYCPFWPEVEERADLAFVIHSNVQLDAGGQQTGMAGG